MRKLQIDQTTTILLGVCSRGPYKMGKENILNKTVRWISWGYGEEYVHPEILNLLRAKSVTKGTNVLLCCWDLAKEQQAQLLREAVIDYISYRPGYVSFTLFLGEFLTGSLDLKTKDHYLCRPVPTTKLPKGSQL